MECHVPTSTLLKAIVFGLSTCPGCAVQPLTPPQQPSLAPAISSPEPAPDWTEALFQRRGMTGADGFASFVLSDGRVLWLTGDSMFGKVEEGRHAPGAVMVNNALGLTPRPMVPGMAPELADVRWFSGPLNLGNDLASGFARPPAETSKTGKAWFWPCAGVAEAGTGDSRRLVFFEVMLRRAGGAARDTVWDFRADESWTVTVDNPGADPAEWRLRPSLLTRVQHGDRMTGWGVACIPDGDHFLIFGVDGANVFDKKALLARAPTTTITDFATWSFWDGTGWSARAADAAVVLHPVTDDFTIWRDGDVWRYIGTEPPLSPRLIARAAPAPYGPWSDAKVLYECPEPKQDAKAMVYSAHAHPALSAPGELLVSYCLNSTDFWHMLSHAELYRARFVRVPRSLLPDP